MKHEHEFMMSSEELINSLPVSIVYQPLIDTNTRWLGEAGWKLSYRSSYRWGNPKIRLFDPKTNVSISIKMKTRRAKDGRSFDYPFTRSDELMEALCEAGVLIKPPRTLAFMHIHSDYGHVMNLESELAKKDKLIGEMSDRINSLANTNILIKQDTPSAAIINNLQADLMATRGRINDLIKELDATKDRLWDIEGSTVGIKADLKYEIAQLKVEVDDVKAKLFEYQNETSLDTIQRLNRESYERHLERPFVEEEENRTERIFKSVSDLIERIMRETVATEKV